MVNNPNACEVIIWLIHFQKYFIRIIPWW